MLPAHHREILHQLTGCRFQMPQHGTHGEASLKNVYYLNIVIMYPNKGRMLKSSLISRKMIFSNLFDDQPYNDPIHLMFWTSIVRQECKYVNNRET